MKNKIRKKMWTKRSFMLFLMSIFMMLNLYAQEIPFVYDVENTGAEYQAPILPSFEDLPIVNPLTDPFEWSDGSGRDTTFASWAHRRSEIKAEIENYEIGPKPDVAKEDITASYSAGQLTVNVTVNGQTMTFIAPITLPEGDGLFPAVIGMNSGTGSLPSDIFTSRKVATIAFLHNQVTTYSDPRNTDPFFMLYPDQNIDNTGQYSAWAWGVSRLIDGLELVQDVLPIDLNHLAVTGCSYAGKMALFCGAFDERIALTIPQESGGGGAAAWRVSETLPGVEKLGATSSVWFMNSMFRFAAANVTKLPADHHELMAMVAPRALLVIGNPDMVWLAEEAGYVSCRAAHRVWENFGIPDRMGFSFVAGHGHCALPASQFPEVEAFVEKFLLADSTANTDVAIHSFNEVNYERWTEWWGNGESYFPEQFYGTTMMFEAECGTVGGDWIKVIDEEASNEVYVVSKPDSTIYKKDLIKDVNIIQIPFSVDSAANFTVKVRLNCPTSDNDSFWIKMDDGVYKQNTKLGTTGWEWKSFGDFILDEGEHIISISYCKNGGQVDKISVSSYLYYEPVEMGDAALNLCDPRVGVNSIDVPEGYTLGQNFPNPFNGRTNISFEIPNDSYVSLKVYNMLGDEMAELAGKEFSQGKHTLEFDSDNISKGIYFYTFKTDAFSASQKMILR